MEERHKELVQRALQIAWKIHMYPANRMPCPPSATETKDLGEAVLILQAEYENKDVTDIYAKMATVGSDDPIDGPVGQDRPKANARQVGGQHYGLSSFQHWDMVNLFKLDYFQGQITKYVMRWRQKNGIPDLQKAAHFLEKYIELESKLKPEPQFVESAESKQRRS